MQVPGEKGDVSELLEPEGTVDENALEAGHGPVDLDPVALRVAKLEGRPQPSFLRRGLAHGHAAGPELRAETLGGIVVEGLESDVRQRRLGAGLQDQAVVVVVAAEQHLPGGRRHLHQVARPHVEVHRPGHVRHLQAHVPHPSQVARRSHPLRAPRRVPSPGHGDGRVPATGLERVAPDRSPPRLPSSIPMWRTGI